MRDGQLLAGVPKPLQAVLLLGSAAIAGAGCSAQQRQSPAAAPRAGVVQAAKAYVIRADYRGDEPRFYRNTGNRPTLLRRTNDASGRTAWLVRFDDVQATNTYCVVVRRSPARLHASGTSC